jgi:hypothetical protein
MASPSFLHNQTAQARQDDSQTHTPLLNAGVGRKLRSGSVQAGGTCGRGCSDRGQITGNFEPDGGASEDRIHRALPGKLVFEGWNGSVRLVGLPGVVFVLPAQNEAGHDYASSIHKVAFDNGRCARFRGTGRWRAQPEGRPRPLALLGLKQHLIKLSGEERKGK